MRANNDVTEALRRTVGLMQGELEKSVLSYQMLGWPLNPTPVYLLISYIADESSANLRSTSSAHDTLSFVMGTSKQLITALEKSDWLDRMVILASLLLFLVVVAFILKQRIFDRGMRLAFWWTRFLPSDAGWKDLEKELTQAEQGELTKLAASAVTTLVGSVLSTTSATRTGRLSSETTLPSVSEQYTLSAELRATSTYIPSLTTEIADLPSTPVLRDEL
jgi:protein transport protein SEC20